MRCAPIHFLLMTAIAAAAFAQLADTGVPASSSDAAPAVALELPSVDTLPGSVDDGLARLAALEARIAELRRMQRTEGARLKEAGKSLDATRSNLSSGEQTNAGAAQYLDQYRVERGVAAGDARKQEQAERSVARDAQNNARNAAGLMAWEMSRGESQSTALAALLLIDKSHSDRARVATSRALRMAGEGAAATGDVASLAAGEHYYSAFAQYNLEELRRRQQALVDQVASLEKASASNAGVLNRLAGQRLELTALVRKISGPIASLTATAALPAMPSAIAPPIPVAANAATSSSPENPIVPSVPDEERSEPIPAVSLSAAGIPGGSEASAPGLTEAGARRLFWHATPVLVQSLVPGKVVFSGPFAGYRHLLIVDLGGGWHLLYGNLTDCALKEGAELKAGEALGSYQAARDSQAEPFWLEVRHGVEAVAPEQCPSLPADWQTRLFARVGA